MKPVPTLTRTNRWRLSDPVIPPPPIPWRKILIAFAVFGFLAVPLVGGRNAGVQTFALVFLSIVLEALPFMLIGSCVGGLIEVFVSRERLTAHLPRRPWAVTCVSAALGLVFPLCECAVVPVVRRLTRKGLPLSGAIAYLLAGPIVNPIVATSTALAYAFDWRVVAVRLGCGYMIAVAVGLLMGHFFLKRRAFIEKDASSAPSSHGCTHDHGGHAHGGPMGKRLLHALQHASDDFLAVAHYLVIGAAIAALAQTMLERRAVLEFAALPVLPSLAMMFLAILLNLCSEADAFIAASFRGLLPLPSQMAFMLIGPMFDLKLLLMYRTLFTRRAILLLATSILVAVILVSVVLEFSGVLSP